MAETITIDTSQLERFGTRVLDSVPFLERVPTEVLPEFATDVVAEARELSSWSRRIPGSIRPTGAGARILITAGGPSAPHAPVFEHGGNPGTFWHPVFGNRNVWVPQQARPFLKPAAVRQEVRLADRAGAKVNAIVQDW